MEKMNQNMSAQVGTRVIHKRYGMGTIINRHNKKINIQFDSGKSAIFQLDMCLQAGILEILPEKEELKPKKNVQKQTQEEESQDKKEKLQDISITKKGAASEILVTKILDEIKNNYNDVNAPDDIRIFLNILCADIQAQELSGVTKQYDIFNEIFGEKATLKDICNYVGNDLHIEAILKKILYCVDPDEYENVIKGKKGFFAVLCSLDVVSRKDKLNKKIEEYDPKSLLIHIARTYQLRNLSAHMCVEWAYQQVFNNLDSVLITCIYAISKNRKALLAYLQVASEDQLLANVEAYNDIYLWNQKGENSKCLYCDGKLNFSEKLMLQFVGNNKIHLIQMEGKYCVSCGKAYILKSHLLDCIKMELDRENTNMQQGKGKKDKHVYVSKLIYKQ